MAMLPERADRRVALALGEPPALVVSTEAVVVPDRRRQVE
jgi:hypothetical protein